MELPATFLDEFDLTIQHGNFKRTTQLISGEIQRFEQLYTQLKDVSRYYSQLDPQQIVDYYIIRSAEAEFISETRGIQETIVFVEKYLEQLNDLISILEVQAVDDQGIILIDYLKFAKTEFIRSLIDANRQLGNLDIIDELLSTIDQILDCLHIPKDTPRYIKSMAYTRNYKAIQLWNYGKPDEAKQLFLQCISDFQMLQAPADVAMIYNNLGLIYLMQGEFNDAIGYFKRTLDYFQDKPNTHLVATLLNNIGEAYREIGNIPQALSYHQETLKLRKSIGKESDIGQSYLFLGSLFASQGKLDEALENFNESLRIYKEIRHNLNIARLLYNIGEVYLDRGQFPKAEDYYKQGISYLQQSGNPVVLADTYLSLGIIQREKGNYDNALEKFKETTKLRDDVGNQVLLAISQCEMVECFVHKGKMNDASFLLGEIQKVLDVYPENKILDLSYNLVLGIYHRHLIRARDKVTAEHHFRQILDQSVIPYKLEVRTTKQLIQLLLEELQNYGEEVVLIELLEYLDKLELLAERQSLLVVLVEIYLIRHQLQLLLGKSQDSKEYLDKATILVNTLDVPILSQKLEQVVTYYDQNMKLWKGLDQLDLALSDKLKLSIISSSLQNSRELLHLYQNDSGQSILLLVFNDVGTISFSYTFKAYQDKGSNINPHLIASFFSALNAFGRDTFETSELLETLNYGNHKLISRKIGSNIVSLLYEGTKLQVHQQLLDFEQFLKKSEILNFIQNHPHRELNLEDQYIDIIENIFN